MKKNRRLLCVFLFAALLASLLTSCAMLDLKSDMKQEILSLFPDATITDIREESSGLGLGSVEYTVQNHDVTFTITDTVYKENQTPFFTTVKSVRNDYEQKLAEHFDAEINRICDKYEVKLSRVPYKLTFSCDIEKLDDVDRSIGAMQALLLLLAPYLPTEAIDQKDCMFDFDIVMYADTEGISLDPKIADSVYNDSYRMSCAWNNELNFNEERTCLRFNIVSAVKAGTCATLCTPEQLSEYPIKTISALNINGKPFTSEQYPTEFVYDVLSGNYYATVAYGIHPSHMDEDHSSDDFLQREIIQSVYPSAEYTANGTKDETTYVIGNDHYRIVQHDKHNEVWYDFYKNDTMLDIETREMLNHYDETDTSLGVFISLDDYAALMGMKLDSVDNGVVSLSTR